MAKRSPRRPRVGGSSRYSSGTSRQGRVLAHLKELEPPAAYAKVRRIAFSPDNKLLAAGDSVGTVRIGTTTTGRKIREIVGTDSVSSLAFLPDGKRLAVAYSNGEIWLYWIATGERIRSLARAPYFGLFTNVFSPDGKFVSVLNSKSRTVNPRRTHWAGKGPPVPEACPFALAASGGTFACWLEAL